MPSKASYRLLWSEPGPHFEDLQTHLPTDILRAAQGGLAQVYNVEHIKKNGNANLGPSWFSIGYPQLVGFPNDHSDCLGATSHAEEKFMRHIFCCARHLQSLGDGRPSEVKQQPVKTVS